MTPCFSLGVITHRRVGDTGVHMGHLLPQLPGRPFNGVLHSVVFDHVAPMALATFGAKQRFQPLMAEHKHGEGIDDQPSFFGCNSAQYQLLRLKQMQVVLFPVPLNLLVWVRRTEELTLFGPSLATTRGYECLLLPSQVESSGCLAVMATADQKIHHKIVLSQDPHKQALIYRLSAARWLSHPGSRLIPRNSGLAAP